jgi:hypothetical protein
MPSAQVILFLIMKSDEESGGVGWGVGVTGAGGQRVGRWEIGSWDKNYSNFEE